jgi:alanine racemase
VRQAWAEVDLAAVRHNVGELLRHAAPARLCAVVKADGYGHGAVEVSRAALAAGASLLAVALVEEGAQLRAAGIDAPVLLLSEPPLDSFDEVVRLDLQPTVYRSEAVDAAAAAARRAAAGELAVHLKVDTGMHRVGVAPADALGLARRIATEPGLRLEGISTHCAVADEPAHAFTEVQLDRFRTVLDEIARAGLVVSMIHAANSAATLVRPDARFDLVRCGIAIYGLDPAPALHDRADLRPAMAVKAKVSFVKRVAAGESVSYGLRYPLGRDTVIATVPIGYADGVRRSLGASGGEVLIGGRRRRIAGTVTMDQITVDCGDDGSVSVGDEVVLVGGQGEEVVTVADWARAVDTIPYEIVCGMGPRLPRQYLR